ncbi:hypothetical protein [uncultured Cloacibacillus sp.]|uniref:hypothetical protein n=1 Tax=uncultured Cloacibacillus sp. TaxID=889794 RepID=UPI00320846CD
MTERRYSITEKQLDALKKLAERFEASAPMGIPSWTKNISTEQRDRFDELMERLEDICDELDSCITAFDNIIDNSQRGKETGPDALRDFRFLIEDIEGQEAAL